MHWHKYYDFIFQKESKGLNQSSEVHHLSKNISQTIFFFSFLLKACPMIKKNIPPIVTQVIMFFSSFKLTKKSCS